MQEIRSSNPPMVTGICDPNKSRPRRHRSLKLGSKLNYVNIDQLLQCRIQSYFEAGIPVWDPTLKPPNAQKCWFLVQAFVNVPCRRAKRAMFFELFRTQNSQKFPGFRPWTPLGRAYSTDPDSLATQRFFSSLRLSKNQHPQILLDTALLSPSYINALKNGSGPPPSPKGGRRWVGANYVITNWNAHFCLYFSFTSV